MLRLWIIFFFNSTIEAFEVEGSDCADADVAWGETIVISGSELSESASEKGSTIEVSV